MRDQQLIRLKKRLEKLEWPRIFPFKFIAPIDQYDELKGLFEKQETTTRVSKKGNYVSITATPYMYNAEKVIEKYEEAAEIKGLIAL